MIQPLQTGEGQAANGASLGMVVHLDLPGLESADEDEEDGAFLPVTSSGRVLCRRRLSPLVGHLLAHVAQAQKGVLGLEDRLQVGQLGGQGRV